MYSCDSGFEGRKVDDVRYRNHFGVTTVPEKEVTAEHIQNQECRSRIGSMDCLRSQLSEANPPGKKT